jgi:hypothetical protein
VPQLHRQSHLAQPRGEFADRDTTVHRSNVMPGAIVIAVLLEENLNL